MSRQLCGQLTWYSTSCHECAVNAAADVGQTAEKAARKPTPTKYRGSTVGEGRRHVAGSHMGLRSTPIYIRYSPDCLHLRRSRGRASGLRCTDPLHFGPRPLLDRCKNARGLDGQSGCWFRALSSAELFLDFTGARPTTLSSDEPTSPSRSIVL